MEEKKNREKEKEENIWRRDLQKLSRILRDLDFGFGRKTFANFWRVSVSENLVLEKSLGFDFRKFGLGKKVSISENLVSEKNLGFGKLNLGKKSWFRFWKTWSRKKPLGFTKLGIRKKVLVPVSVKILVSSFSAQHALES